jgi:hypothetical protein
MSLPLPAYVGPTKTQVSGSIHRIGHQTQLIFDPNLTRISFTNRAKVASAQLDSRRAMTTAGLLSAGLISILFNHARIKALLMGLTLSF